MTFAVFNMIKKFDEFIVEDRKGSIIILFAAAFSVMVFAVGMAIDFSNTRERNVKLQAELDAALLYLVQDVINGEKDSISKSEVLSRIEYVFEDSDVNIELSDVELVKNGEKISLYAELSFDVETHFGGLLGMDTLPAGVISKVELTEPKVDTPTSTALLLDASGSMGWGSKMSDLKSAVNSYIATLEKYDDKDEFFRLSMHSYAFNTKQRAAFSWNKNSIRSQVNAMAPGGGTNPTESLSEILDSSSFFQGSSEEDAHKAKNGHTKINKYLIYMTDGVHAGGGGVTALCKRAQAEGIIVYAVAFEAPPGAQAQMRECASSDDHFLVSSNAAKLQEDFEKIAREVIKSSLFVSE